MRLFYSKRSLERSGMARLTKIDYARKMAFVSEAANPQDAAGPEQTLGVVRAAADPDNISAEFGIVVLTDPKGSGLGRLLLDKMLRCARANGTQRMVGTVMAENRSMLALVRQLGFALTPAPDGKCVEIVRELGQP